MKASLAAKGQTLRRCDVCAAPLLGPAMHFCSPACSEEWVRRHRDEELGSPGPAAKARGERARS